MRVIVNPRIDYFQRCAVVCWLAVSVTMVDIARDLGVSVVTVSKVLRNQGRISATTRKRVLQRAKALHYQMNWVARSLVTRRTYTIGLLLPDFTHPFFAEIARAVAQTVRPHGYHVIISYFEEDPELEVSEADSLLARQVDGLIIASAQSSRCLDLFQRIQKRKVAYVLIDRPIAGLNASFVGVDNRAIGKLATAHLIARGCRRIGHLRGPEIGIATERMEGYRSALTKAGLRIPARYVVKGGHGDETGYLGMQRLLRVRPTPDGVFCYNDPVAIGAIQAILDAGLRVPYDISVAGAGNVQYSDRLAVPLTTVDQGTCQIGARAAELLMERILLKRSVRPRKILISPRVVERESTRR
ncbi:MAG TPA: LacI family DNA-binding transcriptional regulator [Terriglobales bacterium]|jgi:LacI family transcriptional regulator|nr:LacI family DNA-binding transcriptional regulator [Terriglobales bacterium]